METGQFNLSLQGGPIAIRLTVPLPLTEDLWRELMGTLAAIKPVLVQPESDQTRAVLAAADAGQEERGVGQ